MDLFDDLADLRKVLGNVSATDEALTTFWGAAETQIDALAGPVGEVVEIRMGGSSIVILNRYADKITKVTEAEAPSLELAADDWELRGDRRSLERRRFGTNPADWFTDPVRVEYQALDDKRLRRATAIALIRAQLSGQPGVLGVTEGNFSIQYANGETWSSTQADVLSSVGPLWNFG